MKNNIFIPRYACFFSSKASAIAITAIALLSIFSSCRKSDTPLPGVGTPVTESAMDYGTLHYTITNYSGTITKDEKLDASSVCHTGVQNNISLQNNNRSFRISVTGVLAKDNAFCQTGSACSTKDAFSTARYTWADPHANVVTDQLFREGECIITEYRPLDQIVKVKFSYTLVDANHNNEPVTLSGYAVINNVIQ